DTDRILMGQIGHLGHNTPEQHLELNPDGIKIQTASHFQNITGSTNRDVSTIQSQNFNYN
ncbi:3202_t:CDS:2, partial [Funneliformis geosporum]